MRKAILILFAVAGFVSCGFLDQKPLDNEVPQNYYNTQEELETALRGVYATMAESALYGNNMLGRMGLSADIGYEQYSSDEGTVGYYDVVATDVKVLNYWKKLYDGIGRANRLLANIDKPDMDETERGVIRGEALFLRAYYYFLLTVRFGDIPLVLEVPETGFADDVQIPQTSQAEVYEKIVLDMEEAAGLVRHASEISSGARVSKSAVWGILARVCLNMAGHPVNATQMYSKARTYAAMVIDSGVHGLNPSYQDVFINLIQDKYDIKECILEVDFYGNNVGTYSSTAGMVGRNNGIYLGATAFQEKGLSIGTIRGTSFYYSLFEEGDLRRDWSLATYKYDSTTGEKVDIAVNNHWERFCGKFRREYELLSPKNTTYTATNFPILRYSDVLLMYAEAVVADPAGSDASEVAKAYEYTNMVRRRGYGKDVDTPDTSVDFRNEGKGALMEYIKDERARELGHELLRKDDLVRWGEFYNRMKYIETIIPPAYTSSYYVTARVVYGNVTQRDELWPIPSYELSVNRKLVQNKGW